VSRLPSTNIFVLPNNGRYLVYAPLRGLVFEANAEAVAQLRECCETGDLRALDADLAQALGGVDWILAEDNLVPLPDERPFAPGRVTLFLTNRCNLRCTYCYAEAGDRPARTMEETLWRAALDFAWGNARQRGGPLYVGFHGGGEPTVAWDALVGAVEYAEHLTRDYAPGVRLALSTNGLLSEAKIDFLAQHFPGLMLSLDGPRDIQDRQRPKPNGQGSFDEVMASVSRFWERGLPFSIRATITAYSVRRMTEMVDFFVEETGCRSLHFEPVFSCGRCTGSNDERPSYDLFAEEFIRAFRHGIERQAAVRYSAARLLGRKLSFCGLPQDNFNVTPDGLVTSCFEVCDASHPLATQFVYGRFDRDTGTFRIDQERLRQLRALVVPNKPYCDHCFCRWQCAGDCPVRIEGTQVDFQSPSPRCEMNQRITQALLVRLVEGIPWLEPAETSS